jgi:hypothetical protein
MVRWVTTEASWYEEAMRTLALVLLAAACGGASHAAATSSASPATAAGPEKLLEQWQQAWQVRSPDALGALYSHSDDLVVVEQGTPYAGWTAVDHWLDAQCGQASAIHLDLADEKVTPLGSDAAMVSASISREIDDASGAVTEKGTLTMVLTREGDHWVIIGEHYSHPTSVE